MHTFSKLFQKRLRQSNSDSESSLKEFYKYGQAVILNRDPRPETDCSGCQQFGLVPKPDEERNF